jgi:hypothetical protein
MRRQWRIAVTAGIVGLLMLVSPSPVYSADLGIVQASITCANDGGETKTFQTGWNPANTYFEGKGDIARLFCEGGHAGAAWTIYVSDTLEPDDPRRYFNGIVPTPTPTPEPTIEPEPTPIPSLEPEPTPIPSLAPEPSPTQSLEPEPTIEPTPTPVEPTQTPLIPVPSLEPTQSIPPTVEPEISPTPTPTPTPEPTSEPTPSPTPIQSIEPSPTPIISPPAEIEPTPTPTNTQQVSIELSPALEAIPGAMQLVAAAEAIMNIGADMTDEQRDEAQSVAVAAIIVTQLAQVRKIK